jgi:hypothetical protein
MAHLASITDNASFHNNPKNELIKQYDEELFQATGSTVSMSVTNTEDFERLRIEKP